MLSAAGIATTALPGNYHSAMEQDWDLWAAVHHRGRVTGRELTVPVAVGATGDAFVIVLPWGPGTNWARNVLAAGGCVLRWKAADHRVDDPP